MTDRAGVVPQLLGAAVGIVLGSALLFVVVGMMRGDEPATPEVAAPDVVSSEEPTAAESPATEVAPTAPATTAPEPTAPEASPSETEPEPEPEPTETVDPASVSIQVLDAVGGEDGRAAAEAVAEELRAAGYDVVVVNRAGRTYEETTVFWSTDQEAAGRQVAAELGAARAEATPSEVSLSDSVDVHVVVGADRS